METSTTTNISRDEAYPKTFPQTPPYTPHATRQHFKSSDSPASVQSIHAFETTSPIRQGEQNTTQDGVKVEELHEGDAGYTSDTELIYPQELEEPKSPTHSHASLSSSSSNSSLYSDQENEITQHFSRLGCEETPLERRRRLMRRRRRTESRTFKRTHSQSAQSDAEMSDVDGMPDQDRSSSARRLRRRIRGPTGVHVIFDGVQRTPPPSRGFDTAATSGFRPSTPHDSETRSALDATDDSMDVDEDSR